jgi:hypothetical protein
MTVCCLFMCKFLRYKIGLYLSRECVSFVLLLLFYFIYFLSRIMEDVDWEISSGVVSDTEATLQDIIYDDDEEHHSKSWFSSKLQFRYVIFEEN